jgi:hypothetical protein
MAVVEGFVLGPVSSARCVPEKMGRVVWNQLGRASDLRRLGYADCR